MTNLLPSTQPKGAFFDVQTNTISYRSGALNTLLIADTLFNTVSGALSYYNVFGEMALNNKGKFKIWGFNTPGFQWMPPAGNCSWNPVQGITVQGEQHEPCQIQHQSEMCVEDLDNDCFGQFFEFNQQGRQGTTGGKFPEAINKIVDMIGEVEGRGMATSLRAMFSSASQYLGYQQVKLLPTVDELTKQRYERAKNLCIGYPALLSKLALEEDYHYLDQSELFSDVDIAGGKYNGNIEQLIEQLLESAKPNLRQAHYNGGGLDENGNNTAPFAIVSNPVYEAVLKMWHDTCKLPVTQMPCITKEEISTSVVKNGATFNVKIPVYKIHDIAILCDPYINAMDEYTNAVTFFACITRPQNINIGTSFGVKGDINKEQSVALTVQYPLQKLGANNKIMKQADALISVAIGAREGIVAARKIWVAA